MAKFIVSAGKKSGASKTVEVNSMAQAVEILIAFIALMKNNANHPAAYAGYWSHLKPRGTSAVGWEDSTHWARIEKK